MAKIRLTDINLITGKRGTGKSYYMKVFILENLVGKIKIIIWDALGQYSEYTKKPIHTIEELQKADLKDLKDAIVFQPPEEMDDEELFDAFCSYVYRNGNMFLIAEEINEYMTPYNITPAFKRLLRRGRNFDIGLMAISHRPAYLSLNFLNFIDNWVIFRQDLKADLKRLAEYLERSHLEIGEKSIEDFIASMPDRHYIYYTVDRETGQATAKPCLPIVAKSSLTTVNNMRNSGERIPEPQTEPKEGYSW